jgi:hypothetical protein
MTDGLMDRYGKADPAWLGMAGLGWAWQGVACNGWAWQGLAGREGIGAAKLMLGGPFIWEWL